MDITNENKLLQGDADIFAQHILIALDCLGEARAMNQIFTSPLHKDKYRVARCFYRTAYHSMQYRFQMEVAKLFDFDSKSKSFKAFKDSAYQAKLIDENTELVYSKLKHSAQKDIDTIRSRRNKVHAHPDKEFFNEPDKFLEEHPFNYDLIEELLHTMLNICNIVIMQSSNDFPPKIFSLHNSDDFVKLFGCESQADKDFKEIMRKWGIL